MLPDIAFLTDIKKELESIPCFNCGTKLTFKSVEFDEDFEYGEDEAMVTVDAHCRSCDTYATVGLQIVIE